jgi:Calcineurin-like phosphoesterase
MADRGGLVEGAKVMTIEKASGPALISADVHGNWRDFERLRALFLASEGRGEQPLWISLGDWVHGPGDPRRLDITDGRGVPLYDYPDATPAILEHLFALMDRYPGRVVSLCGNHEHAHIGGYRTGKFHGDEAAHLESRMPAEVVADMRRRFASWPMLVRLPSCGVVLSHGAPEAASVEEYEQLRYAGPCPRRDLLLAAMSRYGFPPGEDRALLDALSGDRTYDLLLHGHDREEEGFFATGPSALLLCTSFGARQSRKTYAWLDLAHRYTSLDELQRSGALRRLWPELPDL